MNLIAILNDSAGKLIFGTFVNFVFALNYLEINLIVNTHCIYNDIVIDYKHKLWANANNTQDIVGNWLANRFSISNAIMTDISMLIRQEHKLSDFEITVKVHICPKENFTSD